MSVLSAVKQLSITTGLYRPIRGLYRRVHPSRQRAFQEDVDLYRALLPPGALCFDVGANTGEKSEALLLAGASRVVAFEPNPAVQSELRARCGRWENWTAVEAALGGAAGFATLHTRESTAQSSLLEDWEGSITGACHVPVLTLDSAVEHFGRPFYLKIDVEGWELEVLKGLTRPVPLTSFEFHLNEQDIRKTLACLERLGQFGPARVNLTPAEGSRFHLAEWEPLERFLGWFPDDLERTLPGYHYGDIFVESLTPPGQRD